MNRYIIVPGCSDLNRGDQALAWETKRAAEDSGFIGDYSILCEENEPVAQTEKHGIKVLRPILEHPSRYFKNKENLEYTTLLKIKWGIAGIFDFIRSVFLLYPFTRFIGFCFLNKESQRSFIEFKNANAIFMKGGGLIQTYGGLSSTYSAYFWTYHLRLAQHLNIPVYILPNSFGPFEGPFVKPIVRNILKKSEVVTARETISKDVINAQLGIDVNVYPDLAFYLKKNDFLTKEVVCKRYCLPSSKQLVAITVRPYRFPDSQNPQLAYQNYIQSIVVFSTWLFQHDYIPVFIVHTLAVNAHENDEACIQEITKHLQKNTYCAISDPNLNCQDLKAIYAACDFTVGTRFHSVIFSLSEYTPSIAIAYVGNKTQGIMHDIGLDDYVLSIQNISSERLISIFKSLTKNKDSVLKKVRTYLSHTLAERNRLCNELAGKI
mgnify:CR=1 FL=1